MNALDVRIDMPPSAVIAAAFEQAPEIAAEELSLGILEASLYLQREVIERTPRGATGLLGQSIIAQQPEPIPGGVIGMVGTSIAHAVPVELGTKPHRPPIQPIQDWVEAVLGVPKTESRQVAYLIASKIAREGTKGAHMFQAAFDASGPEMERIFTEVAGRIAGRMGTA